MLWDDFMNSVHRDWRGDGKIDDRLDDAEWIRKWLDKHSFADFPLPDAGQVESLKAFRELLYRLAQAFVDGVPPVGSDLRELNGTMAAGHVVRSLEMVEGGRYVLELQPTERNWESAKAEIAASFARTLSEGEPSRIRFCDNPNCLWVYYDDTRNRSKRYCDDKLCGNLMKVRRFRARKKAEAAAASSNRETSDEQ